MAGQDVRGHSERSEESGSSGGEARSFAALKRTLYLGTTLCPDGALHKVTRIRRLGVGALAGR
jgi:hypothetical protein